jgi:DNA-binding HxlR family transcriptional regulator
VTSKAPDSHQDPHPDSRRSGCPVSIALEIFGDRWSLLLIRDMMVRGYRTFREFQNSGEGIATNILAERLQRLQSHGILTASASEEDGRSLHYRLTEKGIALAPVLLEMLLWSAQHESTAAPAPLIEQMAQNKELVLADVYLRWQMQDTTPILPPFSATQPASPKPRKSKKGRKIA